MKITYLGHSCFYFEGSKSVIIDPFCDIGFPLKRVKADFALSTHAHFDHNNFAGVDFSVKIQSIDDVGLAKDINLRAIPSFHDEVLGKKRGTNLIYQFTLDGVTCTHLGDLGEPFSNKLVDSIGKTDLLFIPVGGVYTIDNKEAIKYAKAINASITIPMHYKTPRSTIDIAGSEGFLSGFEGYNNVPSQVSVDKEVLSGKPLICLTDGLAYYRCQIAGQNDKTSIYLFDSKNF